MDTSSKRKINGVTLKMLMSYRKKSDAIQQGNNQRKYKNYKYVRVLPVGKRWGVFVAKG